MKIKRKLYFLLVPTFLMGAVTGAFLYVSVFAPSYESDITTSEKTKDGAVVIEAQMYGGCMETDSCASFKLTDDGSYSYLELSDAKVVQDRLPKDLTDAVFNVVGTKTFFDDTEEIQNNSCNSYVDGLDYAYEVALDEDVYTLDTCTTAFAYDQELQLVFLDIWNFMENPTTTYPVIIEEGVGGFLKDRFQNSGE